jgi:peptidoglycan/LPS O-acetylase OafA/YrhL
MASSISIDDRTAHVSPYVVPSSFRLGYRPALDGVRAFAVLIVMAHHADVPFFKGGSFGVDIFFVLSGFLITSLLLQEWNQTSAISFRKFYLRRALRLLPALFVFLLSIEAFSLVELRGNRLWEIQKAILAVLFYVSNWFTIHRPYGLGPLSHAWSLSVEEQFYFLWPPALFTLLYFRPRMSRMVAVIACLCVVFAIHRAQLWTGPALEWRIYYGLDTRIDQLLAGCALAAAFSAGWGRLRPLRQVVRYSYLPCLVFIFYLVARPFPYRILFTIGWPVLELSLAIVIFRLIAWDHTILHQLLAFPPVVWIGRLSYGLYLWHFPIIEKAGAWTALGRLRIPVAFLLTFGVATLSFYLVEQPFLRLKSQFEGT